MYLLLKLSTFETNDCFIYLLVNTNLIGMKFKFELSIIQIFLLNNCLESSVR